MSNSFQLINGIINRTFDDIEVRHGSSIRAYHYTNFNGMSGILLHDAKHPHFLFSRYDLLNDMSEGNDLVYWYDKIVEQMYSLRQISEDFYQLISHLDNHNEFLFFKYGWMNSNLSEQCITQGNTYICSFSGREDLLPMWNYYCKGGRYEAYNIGVRIQSVKEDYEHYKDNHILRILKVVYKESDKKRIISDLITGLYDVYRLDNSVLTKKYISSTLLAFINTYRFAFKNKCFIHENECRVLLTIPDDLTVIDNGHSPIKVEYRNSNGLIIPYINYELKESRVKSVCVGPLTGNEKDKVKIENVLREWLDDRGFKSVEVHSSDIPVRY